jgi:hypothetical protein
MPEWDRLASNLFQVAPPRSPTGLAFLHDMMALYQKCSEVEYRPRLGTRQVLLPGRTTPSPALTIQPLSMTGDIYTHATRGIAATSMTGDMYTRATRGTAATSMTLPELCFLCNEWVFGSEACDHHCQDRLRNLGRVSGLLRSSYAWWRSCHR